MDRSNEKTTIQSAGLPPKDFRPTWKVFMSLLISIVITVAVIVGGWELLKLFAPFAVAWVIASIVHPLVSWLEKRLKIKRKLGSALMIILVIAAVIGVCYLLINRIYIEVANLVTNFPQIYRQTGETLSGLGDQLDGFFAVLPVGVQRSIENAIANISDSLGGMLSGISRPTVTMAGNIAKRIPSYLISIIVVLMASYFFTADRVAIVEWLRKRMPAALLHRGSMVMTNLKRALGGYFKAQFQIMGVIVVILFVGLAIMKVDFVILIALLIGFLDFLPFFGTGTVLIPWALYELVTREYKMAVGLVILYAVTQLVRQLIQPKLVGDSVGLNPVVTLLLLYIGYKIGSILGLILAVPVGMILINMIEAGAFDYLFVDVRELAKRMGEFRSPVV